MAFKPKGLIKMNTRGTTHVVKPNNTVLFSKIQKMKFGTQHSNPLGYKIPRPNYISNSRYSNSVNMVQKAFFSSEKPAKALVPSTSKSIAPKIMWLAGNELSPKVPVDHDKTANVYLTVPPNGHEEDPDVANLLGVNQFFRSPNSYYVLKFYPRESTVKLEDYVDMFKLDFYSRVPYGLISPLFLNSELIAHFDPSIKHEAFFLDKRGRPDLAQRPAEMVLIVKTPGGFWTASCSSTFYAIAAQKDTYFVPLMRNLKVDLLEQGPAKEQAASKNVGIDLPKMDTSPKKGSRLRKRVKLSILQQANIGELGLKENTSALDDDSLD